MYKNQKCQMVLIKGINKRCQQPLTSSGKAPPTFSSIHLKKIMEPLMSDYLLPKLSFPICDLKTVICFLKMTNVITKFS